MQLRTLWPFVLVLGCQPSSVPNQPKPTPPAASGAAQPGPTSTATASPGPTSAPGGDTGTTVTTMDAEPRVALERFDQKLSGPWLSRDGKLVALSNRYVRADTPPTLDPDRGRNHVLALVEVARDKTLSRVAYPAKPNDPNEVSAALAAAQAELGKRPWEPLEALTVETDPDWPVRVHGLGTSMPQLARGQGLTVQYHEPVLRVTDATGRQLFTKKVPHWSNPPASVGGDRCTIYSDLAQAWVDRARGVLAVEVGYSAHPRQCQFSSALHVIRLPAGKPVPAPKPKPARPTKGTPTKGAHCTVTDSNGPLPGGKRETRGCGPGESCLCESRAGYSCSGTCQPSSSVGIIGGGR